MRTSNTALVVSHTTASCSLGTVLLAWTANGLCAVLPATDPAAAVADLQRRLPRAQLQPAGATPPMRDLATVLAALDSTASPVPVALDPQGTAFQLQVWQALRRIPAGQTRSYAQLAQDIGKPAAVRAVGSACGANPIAVLIPCHRVLRADGGLGGFHWGLELKQRLLQREARA